MQQKTMEAEETWRHRLDEAVKGARATAEQEVAKALLSQEPLVKKAEQLECDYATAREKLRGKEQEIGELQAEMVEFRSWLEAAQTALADASESRKLEREKETLRCETAE